jgi:hypothetical protein
MGDAGALDTDVVPLLDTEPPPGSPEFAGPPVPEMLVPSLEGSFAGAAPPHAASAIESNPMVAKSVVCMLIRLHKVGPHQRDSLGPIVSPEEFS